VPRSPENPHPTIEPSAFEAKLHAVIHTWAPHSNLTTTAISIGFFIVVMLVAGGVGRNKPGTVEIIRAGFAAGPIPIYVLLPLATYDRDLTDVLMHEPLQLFFAAVIGIRWTCADVLDLIFPKVRR
jgi:hypothetical protein